LVPFARLASSFPPTLFYPLAFLKNKEPYKSFLLNLVPTTALSRLDFEPKLFNALTNKLELNPFFSVGKMSLAFDLRSPFVEYTNSRPTLSFAYSNSSLPAFLNVIYGVYLNP
jgi:hypothetical protein